MSLVLLDQAADSMTIGWGLPGQPREIELRVNNGEAKVLTVTSGVVKKKNLKVGDELSIRLKEPNGTWSRPFSFVLEEDAAGPHPPAPKVSLERASDEPSAAVAMIEFEAVPSATKYEVAMLPFDGFNDEWIKVSDAITSTIVKKKNLRASLSYSFRYRASLPPNGDWGPWSAASVPETAPEGNPLLQKTIAHKLTKIDGTLVDASSLNGKVVLLYFSASWCPPCRQYTPKLVEFYKSMKAMGKPIEVVFVSADNDERSFQEYFHKMGWLAIPFDDPRREELPAEHGIRGIPALKVMSSRTGKIIEPDAIRFPLSPATLDSWLAKM